MTGGQVVEGEEAGGFPREGGMEGKVEIGEIVGGEEGGEEGTLLGEGAACGRQEGGRGERKGTCTVHGEMAIRFAHRVHRAFVITDQKKRRRRTEDVPLLKQRAEGILHIQAAVQPTDRRLAIVAHMQRKIQCSRNGILNVVGHGVTLEFSLEHVYSEEKCRYMHSNTGEALTIQYRKEERIQ